MGPSLVKKTSVRLFNCNILGATCVCPELVDIENENISLDLD